MKLSGSLIGAFVALMSLQSTAAIFTVTLRGAQGTPGGRLYEVDPADGTARAIANFELDGQPIGLRGIAIHPRTRVFYGITAGLNRAVAGSLVTFDPSSGQAKLIGPLGYAGADLNFDASGKLYAWLPEVDQLGIVDLGTGKATPLSPSGLSETIGGGFAVDDQSVAVISASSGAGTLDRVDLRTGRVATGPQLVGSPYVSAIVAMDFSPDHQLYGVNTNLGSPASTVLVRIDQASGRVSRIGPLPDDSTAIAFGNDNDRVKATTTRARVGMDTPLFAGIALALLLCGFGTGFAAGKRRARRAQTH